MKKKIRAWLAGLGLLAVVYGAWFAAVATRTPLYWLVFALWLSPAVAAFLVSYLSPREKMLLGMSMAPVAAVLAVAINSLAQLIGDAVDLPGLEGAAILFTITLIYSAVASALGTSCGYMLAKKRGQ